MDFGCSFKGGVKPNHEGLIKEILYGRGWWIVEFSWGGLQRIGSIIDSDNDFGLSNVSSQWFRVLDCRVFNYELFNVSTTGGGNSFDSNNQSNRYNSPLFTSPR